MCYKAKRGEAEPGRRNIRFPIFWPFALLSLSRFPLSFSRHLYLSGFMWLLVSRITWVRSAVVVSAFPRCCCHSPAQGRAPPTRYPHQLPLAEESSSSSRVPVVSRLHWVARVHWNSQTAYLPRFKCLTFLMALGIELWFLREVIKPLWPLRLIFEDGK